MSNGSGSYKTTAELTMRAYDKLPPSARKAIQDAVLNYAAQPLLTRHNRGQKGYVTGPQIAEKIKEWDAKEIAKAARRLNK